MVGGAASRSRVKVSFAPVSIPPPADSKDAARDLTSFSIEPHNAGRAGQVLRRPEGLRRAQRDRSRSRAAIDFGMFTVIVVPLLRSLKWVNSYVGNYGWSIILLTVLHQRDPVPAAPQERRVDAEDAGDPARGQGDPGSLHEAEGDRSREAEDEHGDDGPLQGEGRQPGQRLRADAADDAVHLRVLRAALDRDRAARRAVHRLDSRSVGARSVLRDAGPDGHQPGVAAAAHAGRRDGSGSAEDDDVDAGRSSRSCSCGTRRAWRSTG